MPYYYNPHTVHINLLHTTYAVKNRVGFYYSFVLDDGVILDCSYALTKKRAERKSYKAMLRILSEVEKAQGKRV